MRHLREYGDNIPAPAKRAKDYRCQRRGIPAPVCGLCSHNVCNVVQCVKGESAFARCHAPMACNSGDELALAEFGELEERELDESAFARRGETPA